MIHSTTNLACLLQSAFVRPACISIKSQYKDPNMRYLSHSWPPGSSPFSFPFLSVYLYQRWWTKNKLFFCGRVDDKVIWAGYTSTWLDLILCTIQSVYKEKVLMILNLVVVFHPWTWTAHLHWMCSHYTSKGSGWRISRRSFNMNPSNSHASFFYMFARPIHPKYFALFLRVEVVIHLKSNDEKKKGEKKSKNSVI